MRPGALRSRLSFSARQSARQHAAFVPVEQIEVYADHPARLITTTLELEWTDVRTLSNSLRTMLTDANTQQIIPVGSSNSVILTGFCPNVVDLVRMLRMINEAGRAAEARRAEREAAGKGEDSSDD